MRRFLLVAVTLAVGIGAGSLLTVRLATVSAEVKPGAGFAASPGAMGGQDIFGPYDVVKDWPKNLSSLPGNEKWTSGATMGVFAESPNRVFLLARGELPNIPRPQTKLLPEFGPSVQFPIGRLPWRDGTVSSLPGPGAAGWKGTLGVDSIWENCLVVVDANGNTIEQWKQWDKLFKLPHYIAINPYDPERHVWVADVDASAIFEFTNDGKQLVQTIGGGDDRRVNHPSFMTWLPDGTMFVTDGTPRVAKFDKSGKLLQEWGQKTTSLEDRRPGFFSGVHGIAVDPRTHRVFVNDRGHDRAQVFDENGKFLYEWSFGPERSDISSLYIGADRSLWAADGGTSKMLKYDLEGHFLYSWGTWGDFPGAFWGVHEFSVDQDGNLYVGEEDNARAQKFRPRAGVNAAFLVSRPVQR